jgi:hypothetical protein
MASLGERSNGQRKTCRSRRARTEKSGSGNSHRCRRNGRHRDPALGGLIFNGGLGNARISAIPGFTVNRRPPNFGRRLAVLKGPEIAKTRPPSPIQFLAVFISFGSLHLLENPRLYAISRQGRHQLRQPLLTTPFFGGNDHVVGGNWWEDRQESVCTCAREPGDHPRISTAPATRSKGERSFADPKPSSSCRSWPRRVFQPIPSDCESVVHRS